MDWLGVKLGYKNLDDWYTITKEEISNKDYLIRDTMDLHHYW